LERHPACRFALLHLTLGKELHHYYVEAIPSDWGHAYRLSKFVTQGGAVYDVLVDEGYGHCGCMGYEAHGHCKHVTALRHLGEGGQLWAPPPPSRSPTPPRSAAASRSTACAVARLAYRSRSTTRRGSIAKSASSICTRQTPQTKMRCAARVSYP